MAQGTRIAAVLAITAVATVAAAATAPALSLPTTTTPTVSTPTVTTPTVTVAPTSTPVVTTPTVTVPKTKTPTVTVPPVRSRRRPYRRRRPFPRRALRPPPPRSGCRRWAAPRVEAPEAAPGSGSRRRERLRRNRQHGQTASRHRLRWPGPYALERRGRHDRRRHGGRRVDLVGLAGLSASSAATPGGPGGGALTGPGGFAGPAGAGGGPGSPSAFALGIPRSPGWPRWDRRRERLRGCGRIACGLLLRIDTVRTADPHGPHRHRRPRAAHPLAGRGPARHLSGGGRPDRAERARRAPVRRAHQRPHARQHGRSRERSQRIRRRPVWTGRLRDPGDPAQPRTEPGAGGQPHLATTSFAEHLSLSDVDKEASLSVLVILVVMLSGALGALFVEARRSVH